MVQEKKLTWQSNLEIHIFIKRLSIIDSLFYWVHRSIRFVAYSVATILDFLSVITVISGQIPTLPE